MRTPFELADVIRLVGHKLASENSLTPLQRKVLGKIAVCRTAALGGHEEVCDHCGVVRYSYNSCGDRHCPKCQAAKQAFWIDDLVQSTLPVRHYHIIFTLPQQDTLWMENGKPSGIQDYTFILYTKPTRPKIIVTGPSKKP